MKVSTFEDNPDAVKDTLDVIGIGSTVNVEPDVVSVSISVIEGLAGTVRVIIGPLGSVSISTIKEDTKTLDTGVIGSTVNVELNILRVSSPLTEELAGTIRVRTGPLGSVSVSTIKEATDMLDATWRVPDATLSNAGRLVLLRGVERSGGAPRSERRKQVQERMDEGVVAQMVSDELLRGVIWGDPVCHMMRLYARRIEVLATNAVMGR